jgi:hypothetical protein
MQRSSKHGPDVGFWIWFGVVAVVDIALIAFAVWAIYTLVMWVTTK